MSPLRALLISAAFVTSVWAMVASLPMPALAWHENTHFRLNEQAADLIDLRDPESLLYREILSYRAQLARGGKEEDTTCSNHEDDEGNKNKCEDDDPRRGDGHEGDGCNGTGGIGKGGSLYPRSRHHFYQPSSARGLSNEILNRPERKDDGTFDNGFCASAVVWARDDQGGGLTWTGAITQYGYSAQEKAAAYTRLGHVGHLVGDMAQPDHVHLEPHSLDGHVFLEELTPTLLGLEKWAKLNWSGLSSGTLATLAPVRFDRMEDFLIHLAERTVDMSSYDGFFYSNKDRPVEPDSEFDRMFAVEYDTILNQWKISNEDAADGKTIGYWDGNYNEDDEVFEVFSVTHTGPHNTFFVETKDAKVRPTYYKGQSYSGGRLLNQIYVESLLPSAVEHITGAYQHFYEVVNHPPILRAIAVSQGASGCVLDREWTGPSTTFHLEQPFVRYERVLEERCAAPAHDGWLNGHAGTVSIKLSFGSEVEAIEKPMKDVVVHVGGEPGGLDVPGAITSLEGGAWQGGFTVPADGSLDGIHRVSVSGRDRTPHYALRAQAGDLLDASPRSPALLLTPREPYDWNAAYEPGADTTHVLKIDATPPTMTHLRSYTDADGRTVAEYEVSDATSGLDTVGVRDADNATAQVGGFARGDHAATITVAASDRTHSASVQATVSDVAGNRYEVSIFIPVMAVKRGPETPLINPNSKGMTPVAVLADDGFSPATLDMPSLRFGPGEASPKLPGHKYDVDLDADRDLILHFPTDDAAIGSDDEIVCLSGSTRDQDFVVTCQRIRIVGGALADGSDGSDGSGTQEPNWPVTLPPVSMEASLTAEGLASLRLEPVVVGAASPLSGGAPVLEARVLRGTDPNESSAQEIQSLLLPADAPITWVDASARPGVTYWYWVEVRGDDVEAVLVGPVTAQPSPVAEESTAHGSAPTSNHIATAKPNPSRGEIRFRYGIATGRTVSMRVYDVHGGLVAKVVRGDTKERGWHEAVWSGRDRNDRPVASGVYFVRLEVDGAAAPATRVILQR